MAMNSRRNPLSALLDYANARGDEASSIGSVMTQLASPILKGQGVQVDNAVQRGPVPQPTLVEFNTTSKERLAGADPRLSDFMTEVERRASGQGINMQIAETNRSAERQAEMVASGKSQTQNSHHLTGNAADIYLVGPDGKPNYNFDDYKPVADIAKEVAAERGLTDFQWGGDWTTLKDGVHFQLGGAPNLNTTVSTMGGPETGGALPQTVEGILSSLYPNAAEDEKAAHRKDIWRGLSQGLSALSQGGQVDLSNIAANADTRRRQYVLDTREKEKAKAAASLVYSQTGDADMAAGVASGAISYTDVLNERQMKRVEKDAQDARLKDAATTDALVTAMKAGNMSQESIDLVQKGGVDALSAYQKIQADQTLLEQEAKKQDILDQNVADARFILSTAAPGSIQARAAERVIALGGEENVYTLMKDRAPAADAQFTLGAGEIRYGPNGEVIATGPASAASDSSFTLGAGDVRYGPDGKVIATGPAASSATSGFTLGAGQARYDDQGNIIATGPAAPPNMQYALGPNGDVVLVPIGTPAAGGAPTAGGAPAGTVGGAFSTTFGSVKDAAQAALLPGDIAQQTATLADTSAGTAATEQATAQDTAEAPVDFAILNADLEAQLQANREKAATETDTLALSALNVEAADLKNQQLAAQIEQLNADKTVDAATKQANLANLTTQAMTAKLDYDTAVATAEKVKADAEISSSKNYLKATDEYERFSSAAQAVYEQGLDAMTTGTMGQLYDATIGQVLESTPRRAFKVKVGAMSSQLTFDALMEAKAAGITLNPMTEEDRKQFSNSMSLLGNAGELDGETIVRETAFQDNMAKDFLYGPKDLTRHDEFGQPYQVGAATLGVTEDTFARHWKNIPPAVKEAWRSGSVATLPVDDPAYAEAAKVINAMETNFSIYQPDIPIDRSIVGIPVPEGVLPEEWPDVWASLPADAKAELTQAAK